ncbi:MAG: hypothetical protein ACTHO8_12090 [Solirubrobacterales bacterium]
MTQVEARRPPYLLRLLAALALLGIGAVHIDQYYAVHYEVVPVIGTLFVLNLVGAVILALLLILPTDRLVDRLLGGGGELALAAVALGGIALAASSAVFLLISEQTELFGFMEHGYRTAIVLSFVAEAIAIVLLLTYLVLLVRSQRPAAMQRARPAPAAARP